MKRFRFDCTYGEAIALAICFALIWLAMAGCVDVNVDAPELDPDDLAGYLDDDDDDAGIPGDHLDGLDADAGDSPDARADWADLCAEGWLHPGDSGRLAALTQTRTGGQTLALVAKDAVYANLAPLVGKYVEVCGYEVCGCCEVPVLVPAIAQEIAH